MTPDPAELAMLQELGGTFTRFTADGRIETIHVKHDFVPSHALSKQPRLRDPADDDGHRDYRHWTPEENAELVKLRRQGWEWRRIGSRLNRSFRACANQYRDLTGKVRAP